MFLVTGLCTDTPGEGGGRASVHSLSNNWHGSSSTKISNNLRGWSQSCQSLLLTGEVKKTGKWMVLITTCNIQIIGFICTHPGGSSTHVSCHLACYLCFKNFIGTKRKQLIKGTLQDKHEKN